MVAAPFQKRKKMKKKKGNESKQSKASPESFVDVVVWVKKCTEIHNRSLAKKS